MDYDDLELDLEAAIERGETTRWSNFLITVSTNVIPHTYMQRVNITQWLYDACTELLSDFDSLDGVLIKPAGSPNGGEHKFGGNNRIAGIRSKVTIEQGPVKKQMHAHILVEICHHYVEPNQWGYSGVHINRRTLNQFFDDRIFRMAIPPNMRPGRVYVNNRLLTKGTDNSSKWLTLAYIDKDRDIQGRNLAADRAAAPVRDQGIRRNFLENAMDLEL